MADFNELEDLIVECRKAKVRADHHNEQLRDLKQKLRVFMIDSGIKECNGVEIRRGFSFDIGMFKLEFPELAKIYVKEVTTTTTKDVLAKKDQVIIKAKHPKAYNECIAENTPQVRGL